MDKRGFVIILAVAFLSILLLLVWVIVNVGCSEILQTRRNNDFAAASYVASAGAEILYAELKSREGGNNPLPLAAAGNVRTQGSAGTLVGAYNANAEQITPSVFGIVSQGTVNGQTATVTVRYGFNSPFQPGVPIGSIGPLYLYGQAWGPFKSWVRADGPVESNGSITMNTYARVTGAVLANQSLATPTFWLNSDAQTNRDTNGDGNYLTDVTGDGMITVDDAQGDAAKIAIFNADNTYSGDGEINDKDAFYSYYTTYLNNPVNNPLGQDLGIAPGGSNYYSGNQVFDPWSVTAGTPIIFVDGNVDILFNDIAWWGGAGDHTIVATGEISITQPTNGANDRLTLVAYGNVNTGGVRAFGGVLGELIVYSNSDFNAYYGGRTNGTILAKDNVYVDTVLAIPGLLNRDLKKGKMDWTDPSARPLGFPLDSDTTEPLFAIKDEVTTPPTGYLPRWQQD